MSVLHPTLRQIPLPFRISRLPVDERGYPVPFFVAVVDGKPDHRICDPAKFEQALTQQACWICGERLGQQVAFLIGPMGAITRVAAEPPSHKDCALFAVRACPFLSRPHAKRREIEFEHGELAGDPVKRNPGITLLWITRGFRVTRAAEGNPGILFDLLEPTAWSWWREGREATRAEVAESTRTGMPFLLRHADTSDDEAKLRDEAARAERFWPAEVSDAG